MLSHPARSALVLGCLAAGLVGGEPSMAASVKQGQAQAVDEGAEAQPHRSLRALFNDAIDANTLHGQNDRRVRLLLDDAERSLREQCDRHRRERGNADGVGEAIQELITNRHRAFMVGSQVHAMRRQYELDELRVLLRVGFDNTYLSNAAMGDVLATLSAMPGSEMADARAGSGEDLEDLGAVIWDAKLQLLVMLQEELNARPESDAQRVALFAELVDEGRADAVRRLLAAPSGPRTQSLLAMMLPSELPATQASADAQVRPSWAGPDTAQALSELPANDVGWMIWSLYGASANLEMPDSLLAYRAETLIEDGSFDELRGLILEHADSEVAIEDLGERLATQIESRLSGPANELRPLAGAWQAMRSRQGDTAVDPIAALVTPSVEQVLSDGTAFDFAALLDGPLALGYSGGESWDLVSETLPSDAEGLRLVYTSLDQMGDRLSAAELEQARISVLTSATQQQSWGLVLMGLNVLGVNNTAVLADLFNACNLNLGVAISDIGGGGMDPQAVAVYLKGREDRWAVLRPEIETYIHEDPNGIAVRLDRELRLAVDQRQIVDVDRITTEWVSQIPERSDSMLDGAEDALRAALIRNDALTGEEERAMAAVHRRLTELQSPGLGRINGLMMERIGSFAALPDAQGLEGLTRAIALAGGTQEAAETALAARATNDAQAQMLVNIVDTLSPEVRTSVADDLADRLLEAGEMDGILTLARHDGLWEEIEHPVKRFVGQQIGELRIANATMGTGLLSELEAIGRWDLNDAQRQEINEMIVAVLRGPVTNDDGYALVVSTAHRHGVERALVGESRVKLLAATPVESPALAERIEAVQSQGIVNLPPEALWRVFAYEVLREHAHFGTAALQFREVGTLFAGDARLDSGPVMVAYRQLEAEWQREQAFYRAFCLRGVYGTWNAQVTGPGIDQPVEFQVRFSNPVNGSEVAFGTDRVAINLLNIRDDMRLLRLRLDQQVQLHPMIEPATLYDGDFQLDDPANPNAMTWSLRNDDGLTGYVVRLVR